MELFSPTSRRLQSLIESSRSDGISNRFTIKFYVVQQANWHCNASHYPTRTPLLAVASGGGGGGLGGGNTCEKSQLAAPGGDGGGGG